MVTRFVRGKAQQSCCSLGYTSSISSSSLSLYWDTQSSVIANQQMNISAYLVLQRRHLFLTVQFAWKSLILLTLTDCIIRSVLDGHCCRDQSRRGIRTQCSSPLMMLTLVLVSQLMLCCCYCCRLSFSDCCSICLVTSSEVYWCSKTENRKKDNYLYHDLEILISEKKQDSALDSKLPYFNWFHHCQKDSRTRFLTLSTTWQ